MYNYYLDCYQAGEVRTARGSHKTALARLVNHDATDSQGGFGCWSEQAMNMYMNRPEVQSALHVDPAWRRDPDLEWESCNDDMTETYNKTYDDTFDLFQEMFRRLKEVRKKVSSRSRCRSFLESH